MKRTFITLFLSLLFAFVTFTVAKAQERTLWIADDSEDKIYHVTLDGTLIDPNQPCQPPRGAVSGITLDPLSDTLWGAGGGFITNYSKDCLQLSVINHTTYDNDPYGPDTAPEGVSISANPFDTLWVVHDRDSPNFGLVFHIEKDGRLIGDYFDISAFADSPQALAVDPSDGTLWITDNSTAGIYHVTEEGVEVDEGDYIPYDSFTANGNLQGIAVDPLDGTLWVTARSIDGSSPGKIINITKDGSRINSNGDPLPAFDSTSYDPNSVQPTGIAVAVSGIGPPIAESDAFIINEDPVDPLTGNVLANNGNGADTLGDPPNTVNLVDDVYNGTLVLRGDGTFDYTPDLNFTGDESFTYTISDLYSTSNTATVHIFVCCAGDFDQDRDIDGMDLSDLITNGEVDPADFAANFGLEVCP